VETPAEPARDCGATVPPDDEETLNNVAGG